jgi:peroxiredoxin Q/BCP
MTLMQAPDFTLLDQAGVRHHLAEYRGRWVVLYVYPKDDTPGCTTEACSFRDAEPKFAGKDVVVLGISRDTVKSHGKFAEKFNLGFPLLSDPEATTIKAFGAWGVKKFMGKEFEGILRQTFIIDPKGMIAKRYDQVKTTSHAEEVLDDVESLITSYAS